MEYLDRPPRRELEPFVRRVWFLDTPRPARFEKILPMPFVHFIVGLADPYWLIGADGSRVEQFDAGFVSGIQPCHLVIEDPAIIRHVGIEFEPFGIRAFATVPPSALTTTVRNSAEVLQGSSRLRAELLGLPAELACDRLEQYLVARLPSDAAPDSRVVEVCRRIEKDADADIAGLAELAGLSHRALIDSFRQECGITPKAYADVVRFHRFLGELPLDGPIPTWTELIARTSYYDQSHFIHTFRRFTGFTPSQYLDRVAEHGRDYAHFVPLAEEP